MFSCCTRFPAARGSLLHEVPCCTRFPAARGSLQPQVPCSQRFPAARGSLLPEVPCCQRFPAARGSLLPEVPCCQRFHAARGSLLQRSLQVRKKASAGIRHFSCRACVTLPGQRSSETRDMRVNHEAITECLTAFRAVNK